MERRSRTGIRVWFAVDTPDENAPDAARHAFGLLTGGHWPRCMVEYFSDGIPDAGRAREEVDLRLAVLATTFDQIRVGDYFHIGERECQRVSETEGKDCALSKVFVLAGDTPVLRREVE